MGSSFAVRFLSQTLTPLSLTFNFQFFLTKSKVTKAHSDPSETSKTEFLQK